MADSRRKTLRFFPFPVLFALAAPIAACGQTGDGRTYPSVEAITEASILAHLGVLASDELLGRDTPSPGLELAAEHLVAQHESYGLEPGGEGGSFLQRYPYRLSAPDPANASISLVGPQATVTLTAGVDAFLDGGSSSPLRAPLTLVTGTNGPPVPGSLEGRIAVLLLPGSWDEGLWLKSLDQARFAQESGATAVVHVLDSAFPEAAIAQLSSALAEPLWRVGELPPRIFIRANALESVGPVEEATLDANVPWNVLSGDDPPNVLALLPGRDPELRDEYIVLSAHFDHVGVGIPVEGDSIYNGADDNGSGTSALLEVARALAALPPEERPRRSVLFAHVSGEEKGLLGSQWWVEHPTVPIESVVANVNLDMIAGNTHPDTIAALGREYSSLGASLSAVNAAHPELRLAPVEDMWPQEALFFRSDQLNFMRREIPALFLFAGFHECYHRPCDEIDFVSADKAARVAQLVAYTILDVANRDDPPSWTGDGLDDVRRLISGGG